MKTSIKTPRRGEVYLTRLDPTIGRELKKTRPTLIVSNDDLNQLADTVIVAPITAGAYKYSHWVTLRPLEGGVRKKCTIITEQIRSIDKQRLVSKLGEVSVQTMFLVDQALRDHLELE